MKQEKGITHHRDMSAASVELHIRPPLSYEISKKAGGLLFKEDIREGETLGELLVRLEAKNPPAYKKVFNAETGEIFPPIVTVVNGTATQRSEAMMRKLADGDRITWFLMYAGG